MKGIECISNIIFLEEVGLECSVKKKNEQNDKNCLVLKSFCNLNKVILFLVSLVYLLDMHCIIPNIYLFLDC